MRNESFEEGGMLVFILNHRKSIGKMLHTIIQRFDLEIENQHSTNEQMPQEQHSPDDNAPPKTWHQFGCRIAHPECERFPS